MAFSKLHSSIVHSSLWNQNDSTRLLFITLLAICDRSGVAYGSKEGIARIANINPDEWEDAWDTLLSPDPDSSDRLRNPENEGRRVEEIAGGFQLLNYGYYRGLRNEDDRREQNRVAQERFREKVSQSKPRSAKISPSNPPSSHAEAEAEADAEGKEQKKKTHKRAVFVPPTVAEVDAEIAKKYPEYADRLSGSEFVAKYESNGWVVGKNLAPMRSWKGTLFTWIANLQRAEK